MDREKIIAGLTATAGLTTGFTLGNLSDEAITQTQNIVQIQEERMLADGEFTQILPGGIKPADAKNQARVRNFHDNMRVDVYDGPKGKGYTIVETLPDGRQVFIGYGPEAAESSYILLPADTSASNTPDSI